MELELQSGSYVVAVSGGIDSVVLLYALQQQSGLTLHVAHFDHGIRPDSADDAEFVRQLAVDYELPFYSERRELGAEVSEATARAARYAFLHTVQKQTGAQAVITAHHQDDVLETAIFNLLRGTGRRGLSSLQSTELVKRPLLHIPKSNIMEYALKHKLSWREDTTNHDDRYARNYIRHRLLTRFDAGARQQLLTIITDAQRCNRELDDIFAGLSGAADLDRQWFIRLPHREACEVMAAWLRDAELADFDRQTIERLVCSAKTKPSGKRLDVRRGRQIVISKYHLALGPVER